MGIIDFFHCQLYSQFSQYILLYFTETNINGMDFPFLFKGDLFLNMLQNKHNESTYHLVLFTEIVYYSIFPPNMQIV